MGDDGGKVSFGARERKWGIVARICDWEGNACAAVRPQPGFGRGRQRNILEGEEESGDR